MLIILELEKNFFKKYKCTTGEMKENQKLMSCSVFLTNNGKHIKVVRYYLLVIRFAEILKADNI